MDSRQIQLSGRLSGLAPGLRRLFPGTEIVLVHARRGRGGAGVDALLADGTRIGRLEPRVARRVAPWLRSSGTSAAQLRARLRSLLPRDPAGALRVAITIVAPEGTLAFRPSNREERLAHAERLADELEEALENPEADPMKWRFAGERWLALPVSPEVLARLSDGARLLLRIGAPGPGGARRVSLVDRELRRVADLPARLAAETLVLLDSQVIRIESWAYLETLPGGATRLQVRFLYYSPAAILLHALLDLARQKLGTARTARAHPQG